MESPSGSKILLVYGIVFAIIISTWWFPRSWWSRTLHRRSGPGLEAELMTRGEAWRSAGGFLLIGVIALGISFGSAWAGDMLLGRFDRSQFIFALMFMSFLGAMMGVGGAVYMSFRGLFRPVTMYRWHQDELASAEFLKRYVSPDDDDAALIFQHPSKEFEVVAVEEAPDGSVPGVTPRMFGRYILRSLGRYATIEEAELVARTATRNQ